MSASLEGINPASSVMRAAYGGMFGTARVRRPVVAEANAGEQAGQATQIGVSDPENQPDIGQVVEDANTRLAKENLSVRFRINEEANRVQIQIVDDEHKRVVRSMPTDEMLALATRMRDLSGIGAMVDQSR